MLCPVGLALRVLVHELCSLSATYRTRLLPSGHPEYCQPASIAFEPRSDPPAPDIADDAPRSIPPASIPTAPPASLRNSRELLQTARGQVAQFGAIARGVMSALVKPSAHLIASKYIR